MLPRKLFFTLRSFQDFLLESLSKKAFLFIYLFCTTHRFKGINRFMLDSTSRHKSKNPHVFRITNFAFLVKICKKCEIPGHLNSRNGYLKSRNGSLNCNNLDFLNFKCFVVEFDFWFRTPLIIQRTEYGFFLRFFSFPSFFFRPSWTTWRKKKLSREMKIGTIEINLD